MADFSTSVHDAFAEALVFPPAFTPSQFISTDEQGKHYDIPIQRPATRYPKQAFVKQDRVHYWGWGEQEGRTLGSGINDFGWIHLSSEVTAEHTASFSGKADAALTMAVEHIPANERQYKVIILASPRSIRYELWDSPKFTGAHLLGRSNKPGLWCEYGGIPIYDIRMRDVERLMILDRRGVNFEEMQALSVEIRDLTDE